MSDRWSQFLDLANFQAAWKKVAANNGCAGVDGETITHFERKADTYLAGLLKAVKTGTYQPLPLRPIQIPKKQEGWRGLSVPTVRDRIVQQALLNILHPLLEPQFEPCSFAYRPGRSYKMAVQKVDYWHDRGYEWVLDADIVQYFCEVQHQRLLAEVKERLPNQAIAELIQAWLSAGVLPVPSVPVWISKFQSCSLLSWGNIKGISGPPSYVIWKPRPNNFSGGMKLLFSLRWRSIWFGVS